jgi:hypothetical protein
VVEEAQEDKVLTMDSITNLQQYLLLCSTVISLDVIANSGSLQGQDNSIYTRIKLPTN